MYGMNLSPEGDVYICDKLASTTPAPEELHTPIPQSKWRDKRLQSRRLPQLCNTSLKRDRTMRQRLLLLTALLAMTYTALAQDKVTVLDIFLFVFPQNPSPPTLRSILVPEPTDTDRATPDK